MVLTFNCRYDEDCYVYTPEGEPQYIVKASRKSDFSGGVYDDLGLSCLVSLEQRGDGILVSAFDSPVGVFKKDTDCFCKMEGDNWKVIKNEDRYLLTRGEKGIAEIAVSGTSVALSTEYSGQAIMVIAAALVILELNRVNPTTKAPSTEAKSPSNTPAKEKKAPIVTINTEALKERLSGIKLEKAVEVATEYIPAIRFKVRGKTLIAMVVAIAICLGMFFVGLFTASSINKKITTVKYTNAIVRMTDSKNPSPYAIFRVGDFGYSIKLKGDDYKKNTTFNLYYTQNEDGSMKEYFLKKPSVTGYVTMSVVAIILALAIFVCMFIGNPMEFRKEMGLKDVIKKLKPTPKTNEEDRIVEHTAYVSSAELEPDFFGTDSEEDK